ncbi:putative membrane protein YqiK [Streptomyces eurocidicus]|uniref:Putative membrane protein YqiK n=1 Tax=Streptomyces eurocidicus TaxID=66423 RepID=A0A7W8F5R2_STREU|nr:putative membrane protein YqiK [Streptomyces eurocidicus]
MFSRFRRKKAEASTEEAATATLTTESVEDAGTTETAEAEPEQSGEAKAESAAAEGVEIPKQQSAEKAADSEAGEGARK